MFTKATVATLAVVFAAPAFANPGTEMMARLVNVDASQFTASEIGQIAAEHGSVKQQERARFILAEKAAGINSAVANDGSSVYFGLDAQPRVGRD